MWPKLIISKFTIVLLCACLFCSVCNAQVTAVTKKYSVAALKEDLAFVKHQLFAVHANPFTELTQQQYEKLFNEIESEVSGRIVKILVDNASPVEYDQPLFLVEPK